MSFFFNDTATTEIYTLSLHDALPILHAYLEWGEHCVDRLDGMFAFVLYDMRDGSFLAARDHIGIKPLYYVEHGGVDRKSTRLNSSHANISYAVFCLKKKNTP